MEEESEHVHRKKAYIKEEEVSVAKIRSNIIMKV